MGEMACYQEFCPHCGRVPPNRRTHEDQFLEAQGYHRRLVILEEQKKQQQNQQKQQQLQQQQQKQQQNLNHPDQIQIVAEKDEHRNQAEV